MGDTNMLCGETIEQLLKKVYTAHKDTLKGVNANLTKYKSGYIKILEKSKQLQKINDELSAENRKLSNAITTTQSRDGNFCEFIGQLLDTVKSYKQKITDKDARINQLENEVDRLQQGTRNTNTQSCEKSNLSLPKTSQNENREQNSDMTSCITPSGSKQRNVDGKKSVATSPEEELEFDTSTDDPVKLKLNRKRSKRSRYSEDVSPDSKKQRQSSPLAETSKISDDAGHNTNTEVDHGKGANNGTKPVTGIERNNARTMRKKNGTGKVLVSDTCVPDLNDSLVSKGFNMASVGARNRLDVISRKAVVDTSVLVVPETLAVDMDDTVLPDNTFEVGNGDDLGKYKPDLTDISEGLENFNTSDVNDVKTELLEKDRTDEITTMRRTVGKKSRSGDNKQAEIPQTFRSILESSESDSADVKEGESHDLDLDCGESLAKDSDCDEENDTFFDSLPNSQKFIKSKSKGTEGLPEINKSVRNVCRNIKEVDALFETPDSKSSEKEGKGSGTRKPLFRKGKKECLKSEEQREVILRRSPRKHKPVIGNKSPRTPTKVRTKLEIENTSKIGKEDNRGTEKQENCGVSELTDVDIDVTLAPDEDNVDNITGESLDNESDNDNLDSATDGHLDNENETIDCYNVMPVKDGNIIPSKKFQVKVKGIKKLDNSPSNKEGKEFERKTAQIVNVNDETLKSPSLIGHESKLNALERADIISVSSSSGKSCSSKSESSGSGIESPLIFKTERYKEHIDDDLEIVDWKWAKAKRKNNTSDSENVISLSTRRTSLRSSQQGCDFKKPGKNSLGKNRRNFQKVQTTLTQGFFSPKKNSTKNVVIENEHASKIKKILDDTETDSSVLSELKGMGDYGTGTRNHGPNGSLDPSAELSEWCQDPETLPSLDTDFCEADLQHGVNSPPKTSTLAVEDTQDIPSSSTSYKFIPKKHRKKDLENIDPQTPISKLDDSFDRLPKKKTSDIAHVAVVRKQDERQKLQGHGCKQCVEYYRSAGRSDEEIKQHMHKCSRHRAQYVPPDTPPHFWSVGFIETQDNNDNTVVKEDPLDDAEVPTYRRRKRLNKCFRSKNENSVMENDTQNTQYTQ